MYKLLWTWTNIRLIFINISDSSCYYKAVKKRSEEGDGDKRIDLNDFQLLVLSLGTGENKEEKYNADLANSWWAINWLIYPLTKFWKAEHPLPEILFDASSDMSDYYCTMFFESFRNAQN